ncbi:hypothetical protein [uncultured Nocardioides sp.]|uniref:hypothetical protein n=1 Tax=uncultured Nocardioides sp. TaxID=198441 RepID=UPI002626470B|nr:hypothetical protein [uncultured Nocardioides sp.]
MRRAIAGALLLTGLTGCGGGSNTAAEQPSETVTVIEAPDGDTLIEGDPKDLETYGDDFDFSDEIVVGDTFETVIPPNTFSDDSQPPSYVEMTLTGIRYEDSTNTRGNVYAILDFEAENIGEEAADLRSFGFDWANDEQLVDTDVGVFCEPELEYDLQPGQRTIGCSMVDVPREPATLTFNGMDKSITIGIDPPA